MRQKLGSIIEPQKEIKTLSGSITKKRTSQKIDFSSKEKTSAELNVEIISDIKTCFQLWQEFSPKKSLFDTWEFRYAFWLGYQHQPYFILLKNKSEKVGLLPLWYEEDKQKYFWFGSWWQEENLFFVKHQKYIPILLSYAPSPLHLNAICPDSVYSLKNKIKFQKDESKYVLNLEGLRNHEDYLMTLKKNDRRNLRKDRNRILKMKPQIIINNFSHFNKLVELSKKRFSSKGQDTDWEDPKRVSAFRYVIKLKDRSYKIRMISIKIGGRIAGVDLNALYNGTYYTLKCGYDVDRFPGIGNFFNLFEIDDAIALGYKKIDFLQNSYDWKSKYFHPLSLLLYEK